MGKDIITMKTSGMKLNDEQKKALVESAEKGADNEKVETFGLDEMCIQLRGVIAEADVFPDMPPISCSVNFKLLKSVYEFMWLQSERIKMLKNHIDEQKKMCHCFDSDEEAYYTEGFESGLNSAYEIIMEGKY